MLTLKPYKKDDAAYILKWLKDETTFRFWCTDTYQAFPPTVGEINEFYDSWGERIKIFTAYDDDDAVGHLTMRYLCENTDEVRLGFILVDGTKRGKGYGTEMLRLAIRYAFDTLKAKTITIGVFEQNTAARRLYQKLGFLPTGEVISYQFFREVWQYPILKMEKNDENSDLSL